MLAPKRPWSTNGEKLFDSQHQEVSIFSTAAAPQSQTITTRAQLLEHIVKVVNSKGDKP